MGVELPAWAREFNVQRRGVGLVKVGPPPTCHFRIPAVLGGVLSAASFACELRGADRVETNGDFAHTNAAR